MGEGGQAIDGVASTARGVALEVEDGDGDDVEVDPASSSEEDGLGDEHAEAANTMDAARTIGAILTHRS